MLVWATAPYAAEPGERLGPVVAARVDLQRQLSEWLTRTLAGPADPYRVEAAVRVEMRGHMRELRAKQENSTPSVKIGAKNKVKLPGLGMVDGGGGQTALLPEINIGGETRVTESVSRQLETEVAKFTILLLVEPAMPKDRRELLVRLASQLSGIDRARGDEVVVEERPDAPSTPAVAAAPAGAAPGVPGVPAPQAGVAGPPRFPWNLVIICATALVAAAILALGLARRGGGAPGEIVSRGGRDGAGDAEAPAQAGASAAAAEVAAQRKRREELSAFTALVDATPRELVQVIADVDPHTAAAIADLVGFDEEAAKLVETLLPVQRRVEIGIGLATSRVLTREQLARMEAVAAQALQKVRSRVPLGGPDRLAGFLALAPPQVRRDVLEGVAARDPSLADAARKEMLLFEDLPGLSEASLRHVAAAVDPGVLALALVGAPEVRDLVLEAVSKRLRAILEAEAEILQEKPAAEIEEARRAVEAAMRQLSHRGELRARAA